MTSATPHKKGWFPLPNNTPNWLDKANWTEQARDFLGRAHGAVMAGTGHRPPRLGLTYEPKVRLPFAEWVADQLKQGVLPSLIVSGGAQGFDQALAKAASLLKIPFVIAVPFEGQERKWPAEAQTYYRRMLKAAAEVVVVCPGGYENAKFTARDYLMVESATSLVALYDGAGKGGTALTVKYALSRHIPIYRNLWEAWATRSKPTV